MLCSASCTNDNFTHWLAEHMNVGPNMETPKPGTKFFDMLMPGYFEKPVILFIDEIQAIYNETYTTTFWECIKRISSNPAKYNVQV